MLPFLSLQTATIGSYEMHLRTRFALFTIIDPSTGFWWTMSALDSKNLVVLSKIQQWQDSSSNSKSPNHSARQAFYFLFVPSSLQHEPASQLSFTEISNPHLTCTNRPSCCNQLHQIDKVAILSYTYLERASAINQRIQRLRHFPGPRDANAIHLLPHRRWNYQLFSTKSTHLKNVLNLLGIRRGTGSKPYACTAVATTSQLSEIWNVFKQYYKTNSARKELIAKSLHVIPPKSQGISECLNCMLLDMIRKVLFAQDSPTNYRLRQ
jgi:hypothetical protein